MATTWSWPSRSVIRPHAASSVVEVLADVGDVVRGLVGAHASGRSGAGRARRSRSRASTHQSAYSSVEEVVVEAVDVQHRLVRRLGSAGRRTRVVTTGPCSSSAKSIVSAVYGGPRTSVTGPLASGLMGDRARQPARAAAAATRAREQAPSVAVISGCHCTADAEPVAGRLHRLERAVGGPGATAAKPGCSRTDWWWWQLTVDAARRPARASRVPGVGRTVDRAELVPAGAVLVVADQVGRVLVERAAGVRPPSAACRGRRRAPAARPRRPRRAARAPRRRGPSRQPAVARVRLRAVPRRVDVRAAGDHQPVEPGHHGARRAAGPDAGGSSTGTPPAAVDRVGVLRVAAGRRAGPTRPTRACSR